MFLFYEYTLMGCHHLYLTSSSLGYFPLPLVSFSELLRGVLLLHLPMVLPRHPSLTSFITLTTQPIVGVPRMRGTLVAKLEKSGMTRAI